MDSQGCRKDFWSGLAVIGVHKVRTQLLNISIVNFIKSPKKWSGQNRTSRTGSYAHDSYTHWQSLVLTTTIIKLKTFFDIAPNKMKRNLLKMEFNEMGIHHTVAHEVTLNAFEPWKMRSTPTNVYSMWNHVQRSNSIDNGQSYL